MDVEQDFVETLYESMPRRITAVITLKLQYSGGDLQYSGVQSLATKMASEQIQHSH